MRYELLFKYETLLFLLQSLNKYFSWISYFTYQYTPINKFVPLRINNLSAFAECNIIYCIFSTKG